MNARTWRGGAAIKRKRLQRRDAENAENRRAFSRSAACLKPQQDHWQMEVGVIERSRTVFARAPAAGWDNPRSVLVAAPPRCVFAMKSH
jgi:hypothetical protein